MICVEYSAQNQISAFRSTYPAAFKLVQLLCFVVHGPLFFPDTTIVHDFKLLGIVSYSSLSIFLAFYGRDPPAAPTNSKQVQEPPLLPTSFLPFLESIQSKYFCLFLTLRIETDPAYEARKRVASRLQRDSCCHQRSSKWTQCKILGFFLCCTCQSMFKFRHFLNFRA